MDDIETAGGVHEKSEGRRRFTEEEMLDIKEQLLESIYTDIGKSIVKKFLWVVGACCFALLAWLNGSGHIKLG